MKINVVDKSTKELVEVIKRKPIAKSLGNFNPHWVRYKNEMHLVLGGIDYAYMHGENPLGIPYYIEVTK